MFDVFTTVAWHDALLVAHIFGLVIGFGVAISIDYLLLRSLLSGRLSPIVLDMAMQAAKLTSFGLAVLWLSGLGFLWEYSELNPAKLDNPKIYAKVGIVILLSLNGFIIHRQVLPILWRYAGGDVLKMASSRELFTFAICSAVSTVSWIFPVIFGLNRALNFEYSAASLLGQYLFCVGLSVAAVSLGLYVWRRHLGTPIQKTYHSAAATRVN